MDNQSLQFQIYKIDDENEIEPLIKDETLWLTQKAMSELFDVGVPAINKHVGNIFESRELDEDSTVSKMEIVQKEGLRSVKREVVFYNLDVIISVGYRVNSLKATRFRQWATGILREYIQKGFVLDDERLKQGERIFGEDYFRELLERVRSIRASERRIWLQIGDIFAEISVDYDKDSQAARDFYATIQNKFHYAITGHTAAEIIYERADSKQAHMGLATWKNSPDGRVLKSDVTIAKNYLNEKEIRRLERDVTGFFDHIESLIEDKVLLDMEDCARSVDDFLAFRRYRILENAGRISMESAKKRASREYDIFNKTQKIDSDFEKQVAQIGGEVPTND